ncbi:hypothetical protein ACVIRO_002392 [Rhizobium ruizarguesonis]
MITAVSIALYAAAAFFAAVLGVTAEQFKNGVDKKKADSRFALALSAMSFLMAAALQVFA